MWLRFRVRGLMWLVLISAVLLAGYREVQQSQQLALDYQLRALDHGLQEHAYQGGKLWMGCRGPIGSIEPSQPNPKKAAYHARMREKWLRDVSFPYLPVSPDPPEPD
jgi:hypothetical protein